MLLRETEQIVCRLLVQTAIEENVLEVQRQALCEETGFTVTKCFRRLDRRSTGQIGATNLMEFLADNGLFEGERQCEMLIDQHDVNHDGWLSEADFLAIVLPRDNTSLKQQSLARKNDNNKLLPTDLLHDRIESLLAKLFYSEVRALEKMGAIYADVAKRIDYTDSKSVFKAIDIFNSSKLTARNISDFLALHGFTLHERDILAMIRFMDIEKQGFITEQVFSGFLSRIKDCKKVFMRKTAFDQFDGKLKKYVTKKATPEVFHSNNGERSKQITDIHTEYSAATQRTNESIKKHVAIRAGTLKSQSLRQRSDKSAFQQHVGIGEASDLEMGELARTLKQVIALEKEVDLAKQTAVLRADFDHATAFRLFDVDGKGRLSCYEFENVLRGVGLFPEKHELFLAMKRYDEDMNGYIGFAEFEKMFSPIRRNFAAVGKLNPAARLGSMAGSQRVTDLFERGSEFLTADARQQLVELLVLMMENETAQEMLRQRLFMRKNFNIKQVFERLLNASEKQSRQNVLDGRDIQSLLLNQGIAITPDDIEHLFERFDKNNDGFISLAEFITELSPKSPKKVF